jgi:hypothetical protein
MYLILCFQINGSPVPGYGINYTADFMSIDANGAPTDKINLKIELYYYSNIAPDIVFIQITAVSKDLSMDYQKVLGQYMDILNFFHISYKQYYFSCCRK